jgi:hypothetical protein
VALPPVPLPPVPVVVPVLVVLAPLPPVPVPVAPAVPPVPVDVELRLGVVAEPVSSLHPTSAKRLVLTSTVRIERQFTVRIGSYFLYSTSL